MVYSLWYRMCCTHYICTYGIWYILFGVYHMGSSTQITVHGVSYVDCDSRCCTQYIVWRCSLRLETFWAPNFGRLVGVCCLGARAPLIRRAQCRQGRLPGNARVTRHELKGRETSPKPLRHCIYANAMFGKLGRQGRRSSPPNMQKMRTSGKPPKRPKIFNDC